MKIGIDIRLWNESGVGRYTRNLVTELARIDKKNNYFLFSLEKNIREIESCVKNSKFQIVQTDIRWHSLKEQLEFPAVLNKYNLDLVHFPYFSVPVFYKKRYVVTIHDLIVDHFPTGKASTLPIPFYNIKRIGYKKVLKKATENAVKIITVSNATKKEIIDHYQVPEDKIRVTYEGAEDFDKNKELGIKNEVSKANTKYQILNTKYFLYVGNAYPHKNLERLIQAFEEVKSSKLKVKNVKLVLVGKEDFFYKRIKKSVKNKNIIFWGEASDIELHLLYRNAVALVMPSLMEGFGLPVLEAMRNKCSILVSDIPVFHEICSNAAVYFDPYDLDDIKTKMIMFLSNDHTWEKRTEEGSEISEKFSWEKMAKETLNIYSNSF